MELKSQALKFGIFLLVVFFLMSSALIFQGTVNLNFNSSFLTGFVDLQTDLNHVPDSQGSGLSFGGVYIPLVCFLALLGVVVAFVLKSQNARSHIQNSIPFLGASLALVVVFFLWNSLMR